MISNKYFKYIGRLIFSSRLDLTHCLMKKLRGKNYGGKKYCIVLYSVATPIVRSAFKTEQSEDRNSEWRQSNETKRFNKILRQCVGLPHERRQCCECPLKLVSVVRFYVSG